MSVGNRHATVIAPGDIAVGFVRVPLDVHGWAAYTLQQVQTTTGGAGVAKVYGSALPIASELLEDTDPTTNFHWEEDTTLAWAAPGTEGARSVHETDNSWSTILVEIEATLLLTDIAVYFFGKER